VFEEIPGDEMATGSTRGSVDLALLRRAPVRRLLGAQWASLSGDWAMVAALPFVVFSLGGGVEEVSLAFGVAAFSLVCLVLFGGVLADRHGRRRMMIGAESMRLVTQGALAILLLSGSAHYWQALVAEVSIGAGAALAQPALSGLIAEVAAPGELQSANALRGMLGAVAMLSGPALAGAALVIGGPGAAVALDAMSFALSAALLIRIGETRVAAAAGAGSILAELQAGWAEFSSRTWLWVLVGEFALLNMVVFGPFEVIGANIAHETLGGAGAWSAILAAFGAGQVLGVVAALRWRPGRPLLAAALLVLAWVPLLLALAGPAPLWAIMAAAATTGGGWLVLTAIWESTLQARIPQAQLSRVSSYDWLGSTALMPVGLILAAPVEAAIGARTTLLVSAAATLVATAAVCAVPGVRRMRAAGPARPGEADPEESRPRPIAA
jgi:MFS family permease